MKTPRSDFGIEVLDDCIVAVGGIGPKKTLRSVEKYNVETNEWSKVRAISDARYGLACTVVKNTKVKILWGSRAGVLRSSKN